MPKQTNTHDNYPENVSELPQIPEDSRINITLSCAAISVYDPQSIIKVFLKKTFENTSNSLSKQ